MASEFSLISERLTRIEAKIDRIEKTAVGASVDVDEIRSEQKRAKKERAAFDEFMGDWYKAHPYRRPRPAE